MSYLQSEGHAYRGTEIALVRNADVFLWLHDRLIVACWNHEVITPRVTGHRVKKWLEQSAYKDLHGLRLIELHSVEIERQYLFTYAAKESSLEAVPGAQELRPGDYLCSFAANSEDSHRNLSYAVARAGATGFEHMVTIVSYLEQLCSYAREYTMSMTNIPEDMRAAALQRDRGQCIFTGAAKDIIVDWIIPPALYRDIDAIRSPETNTHAQVDHFRCLDNLATMERQAALFFHQNAFSVDITEGDCIITRFTKSAHDLPLLERVTSIESSRSDGSEHDRMYFFRIHFAWTLHSSFHGGDIGIENIIEDAEVVLKEMENVPDGDEKWLTCIGREAKYIIEERKNAGYNEDDDYYTDEYDY